MFVIIVNMLVCFLFYITQSGMITLLVLYYLE